MQLQHPKRSNYSSNFLEAFLSRPGITHKPRSTKLANKARQPSKHPGLAYACLAKLPIKSNLLLGSAKVPFLASLTIGDRAIAERTKERTIESGNGRIRDREPVKGEIARG